MNGNSVYIVHLVKFINAYHPSVSQDHGSCFQLPVTCSSQHTPQYSLRSSAALRGCRTCCRKMLCIHLLLYTQATQAKLLQRLSYVVSWCKGMLVSRCGQAVAAHQNCCKQYTRHCCHAMKAVQQPKLHAIGINYLITNLCQGRWSLQQSDPLLRTLGQWY